jgi:hypothetical protein
MMAPHSVDTTVVDLESHPVWRSARRYSRELSEAMRRHPSSQGVPDHPEVDSELPARRLKVVR